MTLSDIYEFGKRILFFSGEMIKRNFSPSMPTRDPGDLLLSLNALLHLGGGAFSSCSIAETVPAAKRHCVLLPRCQTRALWGPRRANSHQPTRHKSHWAAPRKGLRRHPDGPPCCWAHRFFWFPQRSCTAGWTWNELWSAFVRISARQVLTKLWWYKVLYQNVYTNEESSWKYWILRCYRSSSAFILIHAISKKHQLHQWVLNFTLGWQNCMLKTIVS